MVKELNQDNFNEEIKNVKGKVLVDFWAEWCGPCKMLSPIIEEIGENSSVFKVNVDDNMDLAESYGISGIPCVLVFENGEEIGRSIGVKTKDELESLIK
ncbi:MAG: thioredoxin [Bacilli bacterium]|nr:thioredoxin [Bacilli bacterium]